MNPKKRILVVDDNAINRKLTLLQLKKIGYEAEAIGDGNTACERVLNYSSDYSMVLMDCHMPGTNGFEATLTIRKTSPNLRVLGITASIDPADREMASKVGMISLIARPVGLEALRHAITGVLSI